MAAWRCEISFLVLKNFSLVRDIFSTLEEKFHISARPCNILYLLYSSKILAPIPRLIPHNPLALTIFGRRKQYTINKEEKSLRHVVMVAKFLDDNKAKRHLKNGFALFQTSSILFNFI